MSIVQRILPALNSQTRQRNEASRDLEAALKARVHGEVRFDTASRAMYATDHSIYRHVPVGVVIPRDNDDVIATVAACRERGVPILGRGCGTSLAGQCCNVAVVLDFSKYMNAILELDPDRRQARVQPGLINDQLREAARKHGLTFAPDPATHQFCTLGGNIGNNSCGAHTVMGGKTVDNVEELEILTYDGTIMTVGATPDEEYERIQHAGGRKAEIHARLRDLAANYGDEIRQRYPDIPRRVSGYNLDDLLPEKGFHVARSLVGSESTCALTLSATVRLLHEPPARALMVLGYPDVATAAEDVVAIREHQPTALEGFQDTVVRHMQQKGKHLPGIKLLPEGEAWLLVEFGGESQAEANDRAEAAHRRLRRTGTHAIEMRLVEKPEDQSAVWDIRESGVGSSRVEWEEEAWPSWEDSAVPPARLAEYLRDFDKLNKKYNYRYTLYGHFGDGCVHTRMSFDVKSAEGVRIFRNYMHEAADLCLSYGGSLSGEHGDGQAKAEMLPKMFGPRVIEAFRSFKTIWDPDWRMNPGKIIDPRPLDKDLRMGADYRLPEVATHFTFPQDRNSFALATERCFGVGKCRVMGGQTMCPSFQATREESYSTRGRAHLLYEMLHGDVIKDGWRNEGVRQALDLCLQCKGCKHDCPASVDMATYKAEFLSHHYAGRLRPRYAYSMGLVFWWARLASLAPGWVNAALATPVLGTGLRALAGFSQQRDVPAFAGETFQHWFAHRPAPRHGDAERPPVILWPDTFNNHLLPGTAKAAVSVLEAAGYRVIVPQQSLCCGRPLYDYGMLDLARAKLRQVIDVLRQQIRAGVPMVGLEPSCVSVFRDEMTNLLGDDPDAQRLARQTRTLGELLTDTPEWTPPHLGGKALIHTHCHHKAVLQPEREREMLGRVGLTLESPPVGCCGQAGSFGYEPSHYDVSMKIAEDVLLPAVRETPRDMLVIADGFSCRDQIRHGTGRWAMHPAEVLALALETQGAVSGTVPERRYLEPAARPDTRTAALLAGTAAGVALLLWAGRRGRT
ncbi:MAG: FAD-binding and (Fe-S)-binding domain-containing protein [Acetobacteraceae bacterium]